MRLCALLALLASQLHLAAADVKITSPAAGSTIAAGGLVTVTWKESGEKPLLAELGEYTIQLYSGSNAAPQPLTALVTSGSFATSQSGVSINIPPGVGGLLPNAYFLGIQSTAKTGGHIINYSDRFTVSGMTGTFSDAVKTALAGVSGTAGPSTDKTNLAAAVADPAAAQASVAGDPWAIPYDEQLGLTRYAPMQPVPESIITATNTEPLWPTSSVSLAKTWLPLPSIVTTLTQARTVTHAVHPNTAAAQPQPADDMAKYLNRWKD